jgi:type II secretory pathway component PulF
MMPMVATFIGPDSLQLVGAFAFQTAPWLVPAIVLLVAARVFIVKPMRRRETANVFLDLVEMGLAQGRSPENTIVEVALTQDRTLGKGFRRVADHIRDGASLGRALERTPRLLPDPVVAMLKAGERLGDVRKVIGPCRDALTSGPSQAMGAFNYLPVFIPLIPLLAFAQFIALIVFPKSTELLGEFTPHESIPLTMRLLNYYVEHHVLMGLTLCAVAFFILIVLLSKARRRWPAFYSHTIKRLVDPCVFALPWCHKRMQRDFSAMLAILLDAGIPESEAVRLAGESTANHVFASRARETVARLEQGLKLTEAIRSIDDTGEFQWRLANATHGRTGFLRALQGWHDALDARAFQQEQAYSQALSTILIVLNGALVTIVALSVFQPIITIIQQESLW